MLYFSLCKDTVEPLTIGTAVGITVASIAVVTFIGVIVATLLMYHCINKHQVQNYKPESSSHQQQRAESSSNPSHQQQRAESSSNPLQQTDQEYAEVIKLKQNKAYELTQTDFEMRMTYWPMQHWFAATSSTM